MNIGKLDSWRNTEFIEPFVIRGKARNWKAAKWDIRDIGKMMNRDVETRFGKRHQTKGEIQFEKDCPRATIDYGTFVKWCENGCSLDASTSDGRTESVRVDEYWGYIDYKYMKSSVKSEYWNDVDWSTVGIPRNGEDSTLWIGCAGAYSPTHYDTIGWNLHAQLNGQKIWILLPPIDKVNEIMKPTRIPYEETTVYGSLDVLSDPLSLSSLPSLRVFVLSPGDILFVPPLWWHSVQCVYNGNDFPSNFHLNDISISVNTWITDPRDKWETVKEVLTSATISRLISMGNLSINNVNSPEDLSEDWCDDWNMIQLLIDQFGWTHKEERESDCIPTKRMRTCDSAIEECVNRKAIALKDCPVFLESFLSSFSHLGETASDESLKLCFRNESRSFTGITYSNGPPKKNEWTKFEDDLLPEQIEKVLIQMIEFP